MSYIQGLSHINIKVEDVDAAVRFYCEGLGLHLKRRDMRGAIITTPDNIILEITGNGTFVQNTSGITHICLNTYDVDAAFERALAFGAAISRPQNPEPYTYKDLRMAFVSTPTGEEIEMWYIQKGDIFREPVVNHQYIKCLTHVAVTVPDMSASIKFYEALGARLKVDWEWGCSIQLPDMRELELFTGGEYSDNKNGYTHFCFYTEDVDAAAQKIAAIGGQILGPGYDRSNLRICFCKGPAGEVIELFQMYHDHREPDVYDTYPDKLPDLFA